MASTSDSSSFLKNEDKLIGNSLDESSFANIDEVKVEHFDLKLNIDFNSKIFVGTQQLTFRTQEFNVKTIYLDIEDLKIKNVTDSSETIMPFEIENPNPKIGQRLKITIPAKWIIYETFTLNIDYETSPTASAVTWLTKEQTSGKRQPYMYTQSESIHARSIAPLQDTPAIKATYTLDISTPIDIVVRASGNVTHEFIDEEFRHTNIEMNIPIQSYLFAMAAGSLVEKQIGARTYVITEPEDIEKAANEFSDLEQFLTRAETYLSPYIWGVYKIIVLPPSFPFGGMENPLLTFVSPTIVVGDKSSVDVAVHEICHSWFGNTITNINWSHFWLNEGFTTFAERKVDTFFFGESASKISAKLENETMYYNMVDLGMDSNYTSLNPQMNGNHPDASMTSVPYEKGYQFLTYLEKLITADKMQEFLRTYIKKFQGKSIKTDEFKSHFTGFVMTTFDSQTSQKILSLIDFNKWINGTGLPPVRIDLETIQYRDTIALADSFLANSPDPQAKDKYSKLSVNLKGLFYSHFLNNMGRVTKEIIASVEATLTSSAEINPEVIYRWLQVAIKSGFMASPFDSANNFVSKYGRMKMIIPVYQAMVAVDAAKAKEIYAAHKDFYHPIARQQIESILNPHADILISE